MNQNDSTFDAKVNIFSTQSISQDALAPLARRSDVYTALLKRLTLNTEHEAELRGPKRGLNNEAITANNYRSTCSPLEADQIATDLSVIYDLSGVPGFYRENDRWKVNFHWKNHGYLIPVRDIDGQIQGLKIRLNNTDDGKYRWFTSSDKPEGTAMKAAFHFAKPAGLDPGELAQIFVTEGPLKGDVIANLTETAVACLDSAESGADQFPAWLRTQVGEEVADAIIVLDAPDFATHKTIAAKTCQLIEGLIGQNFSVSLLIWNTDKGKGFDDVLLNGNTAEQTLHGTDAIEYLRGLHPEIKKGEINRPLPSVVGSTDDYESAFDAFNRQGDGLDHQRIERAGYVFWHPSNHGL